MAEGHPAQTARSRVPVDARGLDHLLAHADRYWKSQEVNAARLSTKSNLVLSVVLALVGFALLLVQTQIERTQLSSSLAWVVIVLCVVSVICLVISLFLTIEVRLGRANRDVSFASAQLRLPSQLLSAPWSLSETEAGWYLYKRTYLAADELFEQNASRQRELSNSQLFMLIGVVLLVVGAGAYTLEVIRERPLGSHDAADPTPAGVPH